MSQNRITKVVLSMKKSLLRLLSTSMCLALILTLQAPLTIAAQEAKAEETKAEGDEDAALAAARRRYGPNKASARVGKESIFILAGRPSIEKDPGYATIDTLKTGEILEITLGQAIKFSTPFNVKFGNLLVKKENVASNYPGVYSLWIKKTASGWNLVFNEKPDIWGTMHNSKFDIGEATATHKTLSEEVEEIKLDITAENGKGSLSISWGKHQWSSAFTIES